MRGQQVAGQKVLASRARALYQGISGRRARGVQAGRSHRSTAALLRHGVGTLRGPHAPNQREAVQGVCLVRALKQTTGEVHSLSLHIKKRFAFMHQNPRVSGAGRTRAAAASV